MNVRKLWTEDRAVSPVVGVALLIAITVILAAVIGGVVLGLGTSSAEAPQASLQFEFNSSTELDIKHGGGDKINASNVEVRTSDGTTVNTGLSGTLETGESQRVTFNSSLSAGEQVSVVWMDPNSEDEAVIGSTDYQP